jgi:hypothetical protein
MRQRCSRRTNKIGVLLVCYDGVKKSLEGPPDDVLQTERTYHTRLILLLQQHIKSYK